jgi:hypothetical protein
VLPGLHLTGVRGFSPFREISSHYGIGEISDSTEGGSTKDSPNLIVGQARSAFEDKPNKSQTLQYSTPAFCGGSSHPQKFSSSALSKIMAGHSLGVFAYSLQSLLTLVVYCVARALPI